MASLAKRPQGCNSAYILGVASSCLIGFEAFSIGGPSRVLWYFSDNGFDRMHLPPSYFAIQPLLYPSRIASPFLLLTHQVQFVLPVDFWMCGLLLSLKENGFFLSQELPIYSSARGRPSHLSPLSLLDFAWLEFLHILFILSCLLWGSMHNWPTV